MVRRSAILIGLATWLATLAVASQPALLWLDVPFVKQEKNACGAAVISMVMQYWSQQQGKPATASADSSVILNQLYSEKAQGILASDLQRYLDDNGFRVFVIRGGWDDLNQHLTKGRPLIVALGKPGSRSPLHYVVVTGLDHEQQLVLVNDPARRKLLKLEWQEFERNWAVTEHWTLLAVPR